MIKPLKYIVITLAILILALIIIIISTIFSRFNSNANIEHIKKNENLALVKEKYKILNSSIEDGMLYLHMKSDDIEILRVIRIKDNSFIKDLVLKKNDK